MNARGKLYAKLQNFKSDEVLEIQSFDSHYENKVEEFIKNVTLAGAKVHYSFDTLTQIEDSFTYHSTLGIAENGALWCYDLAHNRAKLFSSTQLIITIKKEDIVSNMHQAYELIDLSQKEFGTFIAGPSKTADIEQSLVIGAHGAMGLDVIIL